VIVGVFTGLVLAAVRFVLPPIAEEVAIAQLSRLGFPFDVGLKLRYCWTSTGPGIRAETDVSVLNAPWSVSGEFLAAPFQWHARAKLEETAFAETDPTLRKLLSLYPLKAISNLTFSGTVSFEASADRTFGRPVPKWKARARLKKLNLAAVANDSPVSLGDGFVSLGASGIADHVDIDPIFPRIGTLSCGNYTMTNLTASIRATERALMVNEAGAGFWGGKVNLYSVFLDPKNLNAGLTLFFEDIDVAHALGAFKGFRGTASGRLHGKAKLFVIGGGRGVRLRDAFLYSSPGDVGKLRMTDPEALEEGLTLAGLDEANRKSVSLALADVDYSVLRFNLKRKSDDDASLSVRLEGSATRKNVTVPVVLDITLHGALEQLINTGLKLKNRKNDKP